jgi:hypothetical protein
MALDPEIRRMFRQTIHVAPLLGVSETGDNLYATPVPVLCRSEAAATIVHSASGEELNSDILILTEHPIGLNDRIWLPGIDPTYNDREARIPKTVNDVRDEDGTICHYEVSM